MIQQFIRFFFLFLFIGCSSYESSLEKAHDLSLENQDKKALNYAMKALSLARTKDRKVKALLRITDICERKLKDYKCALNTYSELLPMSKNERERERYHFRMGDIYFLQLQDYENALTQFSEVVEICSNKLLCMEAKIKTSRSYYYKKEFKQAISEIDDLNKEQKKTKILDKTKFIEAAILHSQALMGLGKYEEATEPLVDALETFKDEANKQRIPILLSVAYREGNEYQKALDVLKKYQLENKDVVASAFIDIQIEKMNKRLELQPGGPTGTKRRR